MIGSVTGQQPVKGCRPTSCSVGSCFPDEWKGIDKRGNDFK